MIYLNSIVSKTFPKPTCNKNKGSILRFFDSSLLIIDKGIITEFQNFSSWNLQNNHPKSAQCFALLYRSQWWNQTSYKIIWIMSYEQASYTEDWLIEYILEE